MSKIFQALKKEVAEAAEAAWSGHGAKTAPDAEYHARRLTDPNLDRRPLHVRSLPVYLSPRSALLRFDDAGCEAAEQYRIARTKIVQHPGSPRVLVLTSAGTEEGKTTTAANLAGVFALKSDGRVLLVDADLRRSTIHTQLRLPRAPGLAELLQGACCLEDALIQVKQFPSLYVIPTGEPKANPVELLDSCCWAAVCDTFRRHFDYVILDSPLIGGVADYDLIQACSDGVILVARPDYTWRKGLFEALRRIPPQKLIGVLMNGVKKWFLWKQPEYRYYGSRAAR